MSDKTGNELIAEFMEVPKLYDYKGLMWDYQRTGKKIYSIRSNELRYHSSWNWLMPVVEKISQHVYEEYIESNGYKDVIVKDRSYPRTFGMMTNEGKYMFRFNRQILFEADTLIQAAYESCVDFIKWHNSQTHEYPHIN